MVGAAGPRARCLETAPRCGLEDAASPVAALFGFPGGPWPLPLRRVWGSGASLPTGCNGCHPRHHSLGTRGFPCLSALERLIHRTPSLTAAPETATLNPVSHPADGRERSSGPGCAARGATAPAARRCSQATLPSATWVRTLLVSFYRPFSSRSSVSVSAELQAGSPPLRRMSGVLRPVCGLGRASGIPRKGLQRCSGFQGATSV